jgi:hypothetical protein
MGWRRKWEKEKGGSELNWIRRKKGEDNRR